MVVMVMGWMEQAERDVFCLGANFGGDILSCWFLLFQMRRNLSQNTRPGTFAIHPFFFDREVVCVHGSCHHHVGACTPLVETCCFACLSFFYQVSRHVERYCVLSTYHWERHVVLRLSFPPERY